MNRSNQFLEFGGDNVFFFDEVTQKDYMAIEPICRFFGTDYENELKSLTKSMFGNDLPTHVVPYDNQLMSMVFIQVKYVIGWIPNMNVAPSKIANYFDDNYFPPKISDNY